MECVNCNCKCNCGCSCNCRCGNYCKELSDFLFVALDYNGYIVVISDYAEYPTVEVDDKDQQITFHEPDVKDFIKPDTKLIYQNEELHKIIR